MGTDRKINIIAVVLVVLSVAVGLFSFSFDTVSATARNVGWGIAVLLALAGIVLSVMNKR